MAESPAQLHAEIEKYEQKHAANPEGRNFVPLANAYRKLGEYARAELLLREGLQRHPEYLSAHIVLGRTLADRGAMAEAAEEFRLVLEIDPQNLIALRTLGEIATESGRLDEAEGWYRELLAVDPMNDEARSALAELSTAADAATDFETSGGWWEAPEEPEPDAGDAPLHIEFGETEEYEEVQEPGAVDAGAIGSAAEPPTQVEPGGWGRAMEARGEAEPPESPATAGAEARADELASETLAELYARQGFAEEAAGVYRELIRRRGEEPALLRRLEELEAATHAETPQPPEAGLDELSPSTDGADAFADSFALGFGGGAAEPALVHDSMPIAAAAAELVEAEGVVGWDTGSDHAPPDLSTPTLREYFATLLAWPAAAPGDIAPVATPEEAAAEALPGADDRRDDPAAEIAAPLEHEPADVRSAPPSERLPWEFDDFPPAPQANREAPAADPAVERSVEAAASEPRPAETAAQRPDDADPRDPRAPLPFGGSNVDDDDDLESFQAWLRSLKR